VIYQYQWVDNVRTFSQKVSAQVVGEELERLSGGSGVTPVQVVDAARPVWSALHPLFEWDDVRAAEMYRRQQAGDVLRQIKIVVEEGPRPLQVRAFVNVTPTPVPGEDEDAGASRRVYMPTRVALADEGMRRQVLEEALSRIRQWRAVYGALVEFAEVVTAIDTLELQDTLKQMSLAEA